MQITKEDYYKKAHIYLENKTGRRDVFALFKKELEAGLRNDNIARAISIVRFLKSYLDGDSFIFIDHDLPNIWSLKKQRPNIKHDALLFLKENLDLIKQIYVKTTDSNDKFDIMYTFIKFLPGISHLQLVHYVDLYLLMFHTIYYLDTFAGDEKDQFDLGDIILRAFGRYDCMELGKRFIKEPKLNQLMEEYSAKFEPYEAYGKTLREALGKEIRLEETTGVFDESVLAPLLFTPNFIYLFNETFESFIPKHLDEKREKIFNPVFSRFHVLFPGEKRERGSIKDVIEDYFAQQINRLKQGEVKHPSFSQSFSSDPSLQMKRP
jgi:hypothetical protein